MKANAELNPKIICDAIERKRRMVKMRDNGFTYREIGEAFGISRQRVYMILAEGGVSHFRKITTDECIYPNLRKWMNDNRIARIELCRRVYGDAHPVHQSYVSKFMKGRQTNIRRSTLHQYLLITGLTYEELFTEGERQ